MVKRAVIAGLLSSGCRVTDIGMPGTNSQLMVRSCEPAASPSLPVITRLNERSEVRWRDGLFLNSGAAREMLILPSKITGRYPARK